MKSAGCRTVRQSLVLFAGGELDPPVRREIQDHLDGCVDCRTEYEDLARVHHLMHDPELFAPVEDLAWQQMPERLAGRVTGAESHAGVARPVPRFRSLAWGLGLAASFVFMCGLVWYLMRQAQPPATVVLSAPVSAAPGNAAFLGRMQAAYAKEQTARYLTECQDLLLNLLNADQRCQSAGLDVSIEVDRARDLLQRKRRLDTELLMPEVARARGLCDELENFLVSVSTSEKCETPDRMRSFERSVERQRLLLRINVLQADLL